MREAGGKTYIIKTKMKAQEIYLVKAQEKVGIPKVSGNDKPN